MLNAVTNVLGNLPAALSPAVGIYLRRVTGSWVPFFGGALILFCCGGWKRMAWRLETVLCCAFVARDRIEALVEMLTYARRACWTVDR